MTHPSWHGSDLSLCCRQKEDRPPSADRTGNKAPTATPTGVDRLSCRERCRSSVRMSSPGEKLQAFNSLREFSWFSLALWFTPVDGRSLRSSPPDGAMEWCNTHRLHQGWVMGLHLHQSSEAVECYADPAIHKVGDLPSKPTRTGTPKLCRLRSIAGVERGAGPSCSRCRRWCSPTPCGNDDAAVQGLLRRASRDSGPRVSGGRAGGVPVGPSRVACKTVDKRQRGGPSRAARGT